MEIIVLENTKIRAIQKRAHAVLKNGGVVVVPSDTVYGIAVDATNDAAVKKLIALKSRPPGKAISVFCGTIARLREYVETTASQDKIVNHLLPGPYTLVLPSRHKVSPLIEAENGTLGVRVPDYGFINRLVDDYGSPVTATSANRAGQSPHYSISALLHSLSQEKKELIDLIIDAGSLPMQKPSTVVDLTADSIAILREGEFAATLSFSKIEERVTSHSEKDTQKIAVDFIRQVYKKAAQKPLVIFLIGNLGAGKTVFTKAIADFMGVKSIVSPTFVIYYEYSVKKPPVTRLIHADLYRVQEAVEFQYLGLEEYLKPGTIFCIEWGEKSAPLLQELAEKALCVQVQIDYRGPSSREIIITNNF